MDTDVGVDEVAALDGRAGLPDDRTVLLEAGALDVGFFTSDEPMAEALSRAGLRFDLPEAMQPEVSRIAPGSDPDKPPILR